MTESDPPLSPRAYAFLAELVYDRSRIRLGPDRQAFVAGRLTNRLRELGCRSFEEYCGLLSAARSDEEAERVIDLVSTNHTHFFREPDHFEHLARDVLPAAAARATAAGRPMRIWCAAAASGEEAYSLAIVLAEFERLHPGVRWTLDASDISRRMLDRCRSGIYDAERVQLPDPAWLARYFRRGFGEREGQCRVKPALRAALAVSAVNLFQEPYPLPAGYDAIFCRNVMIYFDEPSRQTLVERLAEQLTAGGQLFVGHAESLLGLRHRFRQVRPAVYERPA
jgi:chemotaxis protein methyltransferase CheR